MKLLFCLCIAFSLKVALSATISKAGCAIRVNEHLSDPQPLLLFQNDAVTDIEAIVFPDDAAGTINFNKGETIDIACPGSEVVIGKVSTNKNVLPIACSSGIKFIANGKTVAFTEFTCLKTPPSTARYTGKSCASKHKEIEIGFELDDRFITHIVTCFNEKLQHAIYSMNYLVFNIAGAQVNYPRPDFQVGIFYHVKPASVNSLYSQKGQTETINRILGLSKDDDSIIDPSRNLYLATGHYTPKADYVFGLQQRLTFYYVNAAPQWQAFNGGSWNAMEGNYRSLAEERQLDFIIYTGSYGISTLPDVNGDEQELYLWISPEGEKGIPVPEQFYKVVYDPISEAGIVLLGFNNPHKTYSENDKICEDVCDQIDWLTWDAENEHELCYCCDVNDFRKTVKDLPKFAVKSLLI